MGNFATLKEVILLKVNLTTRLKGTYWLMSLGGVERTALEVTVPVTEGLLFFYNLKVYVVIY